MCLGRRLITPPSGSLPRTMFLGSPPSGGSPNREFVPTVVVASDLPSGSEFMHAAFTNGECSVMQEKTSYTCVSPPGTPFPTFLPRPTITVEKQMFGNGGCAETAIGMKRDEA